MGQCNLDFGDTVKTKNYFFGTFFILKMGKIRQTNFKLFYNFVPFFGNDSRNGENFFFWFSWKDIIYNGQSARANNKWDCCSQTKKRFFKH